MTENCDTFEYAAVVELVDTPDSKSCELLLVPVQVRPAVPSTMSRTRCVILFLAERYLEEFVVDLRQFLAYDVRRLDHRVADSSLQGWKVGRR